MSTEKTWGTAAWTIEFKTDRVVLRTADEHRELIGVDGQRLSVSRRWFMWQVVIDGKRHKGLKRKEAAALTQQLERFLERQRKLEADRARKERAQALQRRLGPAMPQLMAWHAKYREMFHPPGRRRWVSYDDVVSLAAERPRVRALNELAEHGEVLELLPTDQRRAVAAMRIDLESKRRKINEQYFLPHELSLERRFLDTIEKSPLTDEQAKAVLCFDNRVQVVAAAGSGKTSIMVARAAYAIKRGLVPADRILLLAFNAAAAAELQERIDSRLGVNGIDATGLRAATFHSFGLSLIGQAQGTKPRLAPWLDKGQDVKMVQRIVDDLRNSSHSFRYKWDLYRLLFARTASTPEGGDAEWWDADTKVAGHRTLNGETVRSQGEKMIADWLFLNGVSYEYERPYDHPVADTEHAQYRPDFYYPDIDVWHEHWALGRNGKPPESFVGYADAMRWKKQIHREHGTTLIETTWAEIIDKQGFEPFEDSLRGLGVELDWNPDRSLPPGTEPVGHEDLSKLVRSFMSHVKSNSLDRAALRHRLVESKGVNRYRSQLFVDIYWEIHDAWKARLSADNYVDFEDMLVKAAEALESGAATSPYDLILVDEFQDCSAARARLIRALTRGDDKFLLAVGDDWQSIYRFAGADVTVMTDFAEWFGPSETLRLQTTFRSTQAITDTASTFVGKNPRQLSKTVRSAQGPGGAPVVLATVTPADANRPEPELAAAVESYLRRIAHRLDSGEIESGHNGRVSVDVLGRYGFEEGLLPDTIPAGLDVTFRTIHGAKGLEADYVLLPE